MFKVVSGALCTLGLLATPADGKNQFLAKSLGSNMVMQQKTVNSLYGFTSQRGGAVSVTFNSASYATRADVVASDDGETFRWKLDLPSMEAGFQKYSLNVTSTAGEVAELNNVVFGDVFFCSGQSNMQMGVPEMFDAQQEIASANNYPDVRLLSVYQDMCAPQTAEPLDDLFSVILPWSEGSSKAVDISWEVSGVCWMYGKHLFDDVLKGAYPVGLVISDWGGTTVQAWAPESVTEKCFSGMSAKSPVFDESKNPDKFVAHKSAVGDCLFNPNANAALYNTQVAPFQDMSFKGGLWYQGESDLWNPQYYSCLQNGMVESWRALWGSEFSFMYTQLSTWNAGGGKALSDFRLMQETILAVTPNTAMITAADLGDPYSTSGEIHPRNKTELGRRMSLAASTLMYGSPQAHSGPKIDLVQVVSDETIGSKLRVKFTVDSVVDGLNLQAAQLCPDWSVAIQGGCGFVELVLSSGTSVAAEVYLVDKFTVDFFPSEKINEPITKLSYCQGDYPLMTIYNSIGAPLLPLIYEI